MRNFVYALIAIVTVFFSGFANATTDDIVWIDSIRVTILQPKTQGLVFNIDQNRPELSQCDGGTRFIIPIDHPNYKVYAAILSAAFLQNTQVSIAVVPASDACAGSVNRFMVFGQ